MSSETPERGRITRRAALATLGSAAAALAAGRLLEDAGEARGGPAGVASGELRCVLTPELSEGPFYVPREPVRRDIAEGRAGMPLTLRLKVVNASTCRPIRNASVDVWHCDALGVYSGVDGNTGRFMRGTQRTNSHGLATFRTVYPGWYRGRTVHVHVKVHVRGRVVHTGQLFFPDRITDAVYKRAPYNRRGPRDMRNADDSIFRNGGRRSMLRIFKRPSRYIAAITMGVHRS